jgi:hypothetical protein
MELDVLLGVNKCVGVIIFRVTVSYGLLDGWLDH